nr:PREDICTED: agamous-like MADS-box protein AGL62 [Daucus carota subsp. sativus]
MPQKKTQGRKKIEIRKIIDEYSRQVTFSKRRTGLFNKASELCVLTGAETAIIVESPGNRVFAFGHPSVDAVVDKYLAGSSSVSSQDNLSVKQVNVNYLIAHNNFNLKYREIAKEIEEEKNKDTNFRWQESFEDLGVEELEKYIDSMEELKDKLATRANEVEMIRNSSSFDVNQSLKNEGVDAFLVINQNADCGGTQHYMGEKGMEKKVWNHKMSLYGNRCLN